MNVIAFRLRPEPSDEIAQLALDADRAAFLPTMTPATCPGCRRRVVAAVEADLQGVLQ